MNYKGMSRQEINSVKQALKMYHLLENYCNTYQKRPEFIRKENLNAQEKLSISIYRWLYRSGYYNDFKFKHVVDEDGVSIKDKIDKLLNKYPKKRKTGEEAVWEKIGQIKQYCETYSVWPVFFHNPVSEQEKWSYSLAQWLNSNDYNKNEKEFRLKTVVNEEGISAQKVLDDLWDKYGKLIPGRTDYIFQMVEDIKKYCEVYNEWPNQAKKEDEKQGELAKRLANWLNKTDYNKPGKEFKYKDIINKEGVSVQQELDNYYAIYAQRNLDRANEDLAILNIWQAKESQNLGLVMYYYVVELIKAYQEHKQDLVQYYKEALKMKLINHNIVFDVEEFFKILYSSSEEQIQYYYQQYINYSIQNQNDFALLFRNLYQYSLITSDRTINKSR